MAESQLVATERDGPILVVRLCSVANRNSLTPALREELGNAVTEAHRNPEIRAVYLTGEGPTFCSGGDLGLLQTGSDPWQVQDRYRRLTYWLVPLLNLDKPVVIGLNGPAVGGGMGLALAGDVIVAAESATFVSGFFRIGALPDMGVLYHLPRLIGPARTKKFLFEGGTFTALQALDLGIVSQVVPDAALADAGLREAQRLAHGPAIMGVAKMMIASAFETSLEQMLSKECFAQSMALNHPEFREGLSAILDRREPDFVAAGRPQLS